MFKIKNDSDVNNKKFRARLVVKGYSQKANVDYYDTFSPVARYTSIRVLLALVASQNMFCMKFDVRTAFLNGDLKETIYMRQPKGFENGTNQECLLRKSIYGLKQSVRCWNAKFVDCLKKFDLHPTEADPCVFISKDNSETLILLIYVDGGIIASRNKNKVSALIKYLEQNFEIKTDKLNVFLGIEINRFSNGAMLINQKCYA